MRTNREKMMLLGLLLFLSSVLSCKKAPRNNIKNKKQAISKAKTTPKTPKTLLRWMGHWLHEDKREVLVRERAKEFEFTHPNVEVKLRWPQQIMGVRDKKKTAVFIANMIRKNKLTWDIVWMDHMIYAYTAQELKDPNWGQKHLVNFMKVPGFNKAHKDFITKSNDYKKYTGGIIVGPYIEGRYFVTWVNKVLAKRIGIQVKPFGMHFKDLLSYVKAVHRYNQKHPKQKIGAFYNSKNWTTVEFLFQNLARTELLHHKEKPSKGLTKNKKTALLKTLKAFETLGNYRPLIPDHHKLNWFASRHYPLERKSLFYFSGTYMYNHWRGLKKHKAKMKDMMPAELPRFQPTHFALGKYVPTWAVLKNAKNRKAAVQLLMTWATPSTAERWVDYTKNPTGLRGHLASPEQGKDPLERFQATMTQKYGGSLDYSANNAGYLLGKDNAQLQFPLKKELIALLEGKTTANKAFQRIVKQCK